MIITKTEEFHKKFLYDLSSLVMFKKEYLESIKKYDDEKKLFTIGYGNQPARSVKFFGSYFDKKTGQPVTDIDVILLISNVKDERFYLRLREVLSNLNRTNFRFVRFYCGYINGLEPVWKIGETGDCNFDLDKIEVWLENVKSTYPNIYEKIRKYFEKDTISMNDLINADKAIEPYISLTWTREEIIQGYKMYNNVKYDFREAMYTYNRYRVMKFLYAYKGKYCLVDLNFVSKDKSIPRTQKDALSYYTNDIYQKFKYLKRMLIDEKLQEFFDERKTAIGHITPLAAFVELFQKIKKYNIVPADKIVEMEKYASVYAKENNISTTDYDEIQKILADTITPIYEKYIPFIKDKFKADIYIFNIRSLQLNEQVPKNIIKERMKNGTFDCNLFPINVNHIKYLYEKAEDVLLDPYELYDCIHKAYSSQTKISFSDLIDNIFTKQKFKIVAKKEGKYKLLLDGEKIKSSTDLKKLQQIALVGI